MAYWLCITNEENWKVIKEKNIWGVPERHKNIISKVKPGDKLLIYLKQERVNDEIKPSRIVGVYEVVSEVFRDSSRIFSSKGMRKTNETFPYRIKIKPIEIFNKPIEFKPLIPKLKFITNKESWKFYIRISMREIPKKDFETIMNYSSLR